MLKKDLVNDMRRYVSGGGFITKKELTEYLGRKDQHYVEKFVNHLERIDGRLYFIPDVADSLLKFKGIKE